jgi:hypothetical protein
VTRGSTNERPLLAGRGQSMRAHFVFAALAVAAAGGQHALGVLREETRPTATHDLCRLNGAQGSEPWEACEALKHIVAIGSEKGWQRSLALGTPPVTATDIFSLSQLASASARAQ